MGLGKLSTMLRRLLDGTSPSVRRKGLLGARRGRAVRHDWTRGEIRAIYDRPLLELVWQAAEVHRKFHEPGEVQVCRLISVKTGGCVEDCAYCSQASRYQTGVKSEPMLEKRAVLAIARQARENGVSRVCMGAAWRSVRDNEQFDRVLEMVREVTELGLEVCCTLGMLTADQARRLEAAGLYAYNHNLDTSEEYYETIITTRRYADRLKTLERVRQTRVTVCCGGILGLGESKEDRVALLQTLSSLRPHPESVPINLLSPVAGTPLAGESPVPFTEVVRAVATARVLMPRAVVRLSAGRDRLGAAEQALCFLAGANSIFSSDEGKMLTRAVPSPDYDADRELLGMLGLRQRRAFKPTRAEAARRDRGTGRGRRRGADRVGVGP
jgi:biotin synthase